MTQIANIPEPQPAIVWLETLPNPYKEKAMTYVLDWTKDLPCRGVKQAITCAFVWKSTAEGYTYWRDLYNALN